MITSTLIVSLAGTTIEGVIEWSDGRRRRLENDAVAVATPGWLLECDQKLASFGSAERAIWVARFKDVQARARGQAFASNGQLRLLLPPGLCATQVEGLVVAAHLAGFPSVECLGLEVVLMEAGSDTQGARHLLVQTSGKQSRMWSFVAGANQESEQTYFDLGDACSLEVACRRLGQPDPCAPGDLERIEAVLASQLSAPDDTLPARLCLVSQKGPPRVQFVGRAIREEWSRAGVERIKSALDAAGFEPASFASIDLFGIGSLALRQEFNSQWPEVSCNAALSLSSELETIGASEAGEARLQARLGVSAGIAQRIAGMTFGEAIAVPAGLPLPATRVFESFPTAALINDFSLQYGENPALAPTVGKIELPQLLETKSFCRLKLRVLADSDRHLVYSVTIADGLVDETLIYNKQTGETEALSTRDLDSIEGLVKRQVAEPFDQDAGLPDSQFS